MKSTIIVIGGLSAGPSAAAKARRMNEHAEIILFEKTKYVSYATCGIPYSLSDVIPDRNKLMVVKPDLLRTRFNIDVRLEEEVIDIKPETHEVTTSKGTYTYNKLIYAAGASPFVPPLEGLNETHNWSNCRTIEDLDKIKASGVMDGKKHITVLGAGLIGVEVSENLKEIGKDVTLVEMAPSVLPIWDGKYGYMAETVMKEHGIDVKTNTTVQSISKTGDQITAVHLSNGETLHTDYLMMGIGGRPNTHLLTSKGAEHLANGAIKVNERMETSLPDIYAAGDCASIKNLQTGAHDYFPMGTHSNKGGRAAGANAAGGNELFKGAYKTAIVKVFDYTLARTGHNARSLKMAGRDYNTSFFVTPASPGFYPGATDLYLELYYDPSNGVVLGAEIFGKNGVDKRIDVLSTAIYARLTLEDLQNLDLAYAPPYSPAKDPVIVSGYISDNRRKMLLREFSVDGLETYMREHHEEEYQLIDVRNPGELENEGTIDTATNIPLDVLREGIAELDPNKPTIVYCAKGLRGYVAATILMNKGFDKLYNLGGGFKGWLAQGGPVVKAFSDKLS